MLRRVSMVIVRSSGPILILLSAAAFGAMAVFGRLAYADGATVGTLLSARFLLAAAVSWALLLGTVLGVCTAFVYSAYILVSERVAARLAPRLLAALVCTGAAGTLTVASAALGELRPDDVTAAGWGWVACIGLVSTVVAVALF